jgi:hypothetical protein
MKLTALFRFITFAFVSFHAGCFLLFFLHVSCLSGIPFEVAKRKHTWRSKFIRILYFKAVDVTEQDERKGRKEEK